MVNRSSLFKCFAPAIIPTVLASEVASACDGGVRRTSIGLVGLFFRSFFEDADLDVLCRFGDDETEEGLHKDFELFPFLLQH